MDLKYINTFNTIVEEGTFKAAAEKLNYTQSTITFHIDQLESELSCQLFDKVGRNMILSSAGTAFVPYVKQILEAVNNAKEFQFDLNNCTGELKIGVAETFLCYRLPEVFKELVAKAPKAKLTIRSMNCYDIRDSLLDGSIDVGILYKDINRSFEKLILQPLQEYKVSMVSSPKLAQHITDVIEQKSTIDVPFIINEENCIFRQIFEKYLSDNCIDLNQTIELESIETIKSLVQNDVGISFLPRFTIEDELKTGKLLEIPTGVKHDSITISLCHHKNTWISPLMQMFIDLVSEHQFM